MHKGKVIAEKGEYKVIDCEKCGFKHLNPIPSEEKMNKYYSEKYYSEGKEKGRSAMRLLMEGEKRETHLRWLNKTLYKDNLYFSELFTKTTHKPKRILDVGCGTGDFLKYMAEAGWITFGLEPSKLAFNKAKSLGLDNIYNMTIEEYAEENSNLKGYFHVVTLMGILHHTPNPKEILEIAKSYLKPDGILCVADPNEFSTFQLTAQRILNKDMWWVFPPEHINYFNFQTYEKLIKSVGFDPILKTTNFPMEQFLLMGEDYVGNDEVGNRCHQKRIKFDLSLSDEVRRNMYMSLAKAGIGRECIVYAKVKKK